LIKRGILLGLVEGTISYWKDNKRE